MGIGDLDYKSLIEIDSVLEMKPGTDLLLSYCSRCPIFRFEYEVKDKHPVLNYRFLTFDEVKSTNRKKVLSLKRIMFFLFRTGPSKEDFALFGINLIPNISEINLVQINKSTKGKFDLEVIME